MINTSYEILSSSFENSKNEIKKSNNDFLNTINSIKNSTDIELSYEEVKKLSLEDIEKNYEDGDKKTLLKTLKMATMFSKDEILTKTLFNTVSNMPIENSYDYLSSKFSDKSNYLKAKSENISLFDLLHKSLSFSVNGNKNSISKEDLDDILLQVNSFNFLESLSNNYKKGSDKYKKDNDRYTFLYKDYAKDYEDIIKKYKDYESLDKSIIKQF
jgi:antitoxin component HigA of HigAB toxin-antitoxin module